MENMNKTYRNSILRLSKKNVLKADNPDLGLLAGGVYEYSDESILEILNKWAETKKIEYFMIEHNAGEENDHFHLVIRFPDNSQCSFRTLKRKFPFGDIEKCQYGVKACVQYLVHMNNPEKKQYAWSDVITNAPDILEKYKIPGKANLDARLDRIINKILSGEIKRYELDKIEPDLYIRYKRRIEAAFEYYIETLKADPNRCVTIIVIQGEPGLGKSTFCKAWAKENGKSIRFSSASNDPWTDYAQEQVFVYDDYNPEKVKIEDMIKALDPHVASSASSRYSNKYFVGDTIFICTNTDILEWFKYENASLREAFFRRISYVITFDGLSEDKVASCTINEIQCVRGHRDLLPISEVHFDLKPYLNLELNQKNNFVESLSGIIS